MVATSRYRLCGHSCGNSERHPDFGSRPVQYGQRVDLATLASDTSGTPHFRFVPRNQLL